MDLFDQLAFLGRKYQPQVVPRTGSPRFSMGDVLELFNHAAILELTPVIGEKPGPTIRPDSVRKLKVSLLDDGFAAIHSSNADWYEVHRTAPTGDLSKVKIIAYSPAGAKIGELRALVGRRSYDHYFEEDPIFDALSRQTH